MTNKRILIVGGSSGIGFAVAKKAQQHGAHILIASRNATARKSKLLKELSEKLVKFYDLDIRSPSAAQKMFERIDSIDHLIITVKPEIHSNSFQSTDIQEARQAFETKFWGAYEFIQKAQYHIPDDGSITLTSGIAGEKIYQAASTMALINSATETLGRSLAVELSPIRVNIVSPGFVKPKPKSLQNLANQFPAQRLGSPDEIASAYVSLMQNDYITGTVMTIDGGATLI